MPPCVPCHGWRLRFGFCLVAALWPVCGLAAAASSASSDSFSRLAAAMRAGLRGSYYARQETLFAAGPSGRQWLRVVTDVVHAGRRSRLTYRFPLSVADLVVTDNGALVTQLQPSCHLFLQHRSPAREADFEEEMALLRRNYRCLRRGQARLDGRLCDLIALLPRTGTGCRRVVWIDHLRPLVLCTVEYDELGRRRSVSTLTGLRFVSVPAALFSPRPPLGTKIEGLPPSLPFARAWKEAGANGMAPCWLPPGWRLRRCSLAACPGGGSALRLRFSDGLQTLSVIEESLSPALPPLPLQQKMLTEQLGRYGQQVWVMESGGMRVTVVGAMSLPPSLGREMLHALRLETQEQLARGLARDFGLPAAAQAAILRKRGWGYEQIAASLLSRSQTSSSDREAQARAWIARTLAAHRVNLTEDRR